LRFVAQRSQTAKVNSVEPIGDLEAVSSIAKKLMAMAYDENKKVRLLGISLSNFGLVPPPQTKVELLDQLRLF